RRGSGPGGAARAAPPRTPRHGRLRSARGGARRAAVGGVRPAQPRGDAVRAGARGGAHRPARARRRRAAAARRPGRGAGTRGGGGAARALAAGAAAARTHAGGPAERRTRRPRRARAAASRRAAIAGRAAALGRARRPRPRVGAHRALAGAGAPRRAAAAARRRFRCRQDDAAPRAGGARLARRPHGRVAVVRRRRARRGTRAHDAVAARGRRRRIPGHLRAGGRPAPAPRRPGGAAARRRIERAEALERADLPALVASAIDWGRDIERHGGAPILLLDDVEHLDAVSLAFARRLISSERAGVFRWVWASAQPLWGEGSVAGVLRETGLAEEMSLRPLDREWSDRLLATRLQSAPPVELADAVWQRCGGHPAWTVEALRVTTHAGAIRETERGL